MWLEKWTPNFKSKEDSPIVLVQILLPELPLHCHTWHYVKQIVSPTGNPLSMDLATDHRTRPSMAKVRVEVDLTKPKLNSVWVGQEDESNPLKGFAQNLEYENVPKYCRHCKLLGHSILQCRKAEKKIEGEGNSKGKNIADDKGTSTSHTTENNEMQQESIKNIEKEHQVNEEKEQTLADMIQSIKAKGGQNKTK